jgi:spermidine synthase
MNILQGLQSPKVIYETNSQYNGRIYITEWGHTRKLIVDSILQSINADSPICDRLYWGKVINILKENEPDFKNLLLLGLGGGTLINLLSKNFPQANLVSVEIDQKMVDIANDYFGIKDIPNHKTVVADAMRVVVEPEEFDLAPSSFQVAVVDIYIGSTYPELGKSGNFIAALKRMVAPDGLIIFNRIYTEEHQEDVNLFIDYISKTLKNVKCLVVAGYTNSDNVLVYGRNS